MGIVIGLILGLFVGLNYKSEPRSKYDCLKLSGYEAKLACVKIYFPKK